MISYLQIALSTWALFESPQTSNNVTICLMQIYLNGTYQ